MKQTTKRFKEKFTYSSFTWNGDNRIGEKMAKMTMKKMLSFIHSELALRDQELLEKIEALRTERPMRTMEELALAMSDFEKLSELDKQRVIHKDNGFYLKNVEYFARTQALTDVSEVVRGKEK